MPARASEACRGRTSGEPGEVATRTRVAAGLRSARAAEPAVARAEAWKGGRTEAASDGPGRRAPRGARVEAGPAGPRAERRDGREAEFRVAPARVSAVRWTDGGPA
ncbi:MAG: hypothetical protein OXI12_01825, partial [Gammaproteobacteria bacterium]|nr:hypothetical protein [Gammaproteobacteria bacterium]